MIDRTAPGTVTVSAFDQGQGRASTRPVDAMVLDLEGEVETTIAGEPHLLTAGDSIIMPAGKPHAVKALTPFKMVKVVKTTTNNTQTK